jgi:type I restriction enzyme, S subunit
MNRIEQMIDDLCPTGVPSLEINQLGYLYPGLSGKGKSDFSGGNAPFVSYLDIGNNPSLPKEISTMVVIGPDENQNAIQRGDLLFTGSSEDAEGVGLTSEVEYQPETPTFLNSFCFGFRPQEGKFATGYLKHLFRSWAVRKRIMSCSNGVTRINISKKLLIKLEIPVPPLEIQREIVSILDRFALLEAELEAELILRRQQYEHYRNALLTFKVDGGS